MPDVVTVLKQECLGSLVEQQIPLSSCLVGKLFCLDAKGSIKYLRTIYLEYWRLLLMLLL